MTTSLQTIIDNLDAVRAQIRAYRAVNPPYETSVQALVNAAGDNCDQAALKLAEAQYQEDGTFVVEG